VAGVEVIGTVDVDQFWPKGDSDADTLVMRVKKIRVDGESSAQFDGAYALDYGKKRELFREGCMRARLEGVDCLLGRPDQSALRSLRGARHGRGNLASQLEPGGAQAGCEPREDSLVEALDRFRRGAELGGGFGVGAAFHVENAVHAPFLGRHARLDVGETLLSLLVAHRRVQLVLAATGGAFEDQAAHEAGDAGSYALAGERAGSSQ